MLDDVLGIALPDAVLDMALAEAVLDGEPVLPDIDRRSSMLALICCAGEAGLDGIELATGLVGDD